MALAPQHSRRTPAELDALRIALVEIARQHHPLSVRQGPPNRFLKQRIVDYLDLDELRRLRQIEDEEHRQLERWTRTLGKNPRGG